MVLKVASLTGSKVSNAWLTFLMSIASILNSPSRGFVSATSFATLLANPIACALRDYVA